MRIAYLGPNQVYCADRYGATQGEITKQVNVAQALAAMGHDVTLTGAPGSSPARGLVRIVEWRDIDVGAYDAVLIGPEHQHRTARAAGVLDAVRVHPNVMGWFDSWLVDDGHEVGYCRAIGASTPAVVAWWRRAMPKADVFMLPWAVTEHPQHMNPWAGTSILPRVICTGFADERTISAMNAIAHAEVCELWVALYTKVRLADGIKTAGLTIEERERLFDPRVRFLSDLRNVHAGPTVQVPTEERCHGPLYYDDLHAFYQHARAAIVFGRDPVRNTIHTSRIYDQLGAGLEIVVEHTVGNHGDAVNVGAAEVVPFNDPSALLDGLRRVFARSHERDRIRSEALGFGTWADRARTIDGVLVRGLR